MTTHRSVILLVTIDHQFLYMLQIRTAFKQFSISRLPHYIIEGQSNNFWYIYYESVITYLVNLRPTNDVDIFDGTVAGIGGDHIDFNVITLRNGDPVVKTHKTVYTDIGGLMFSRSTPDVCNFVYKGIANFDDIRHERSGNRIGDRIADIYNTRDKNIIEHLCKVMEGIAGGKKRMHGGTFLGAHEIISNLVIKPIYEKRPDMLEVKVLHKDRAKHIVVLIDFIEDTGAIMLVKWPINNPSAIAEAIDNIMEYKKVF